MSSISIVSLLHDYEVKDVKVHTFKLQHEDNEEKETFDVEKSDGITIEMLFNTFNFFLKAFHFFKEKHSYVNPKLGYLTLLIYVSMCFNYPQRVI